MSSRVDDLEIEPGFRATYLAQRLDEHFLRAADANAAIYLCMQVSMLGLDQVFAQPVNKSLLIFVRPIAIALCLVYPLARRRSPLLARYHILGLNLFIAGVMAVCLSRLGAAASTGQALGASASYFGLVVFMIIGMPFGKGTSAVVAVAYVGLAALAAVFGDPGLWTYVLAIAIAVAISWGIHMSNTSSVGRQALGELRLSLQIAPHDLVRRSAFGSRASLGEALRPRRRRCVCLASDWRGFQAAAQRVGPEALVAAIEAYYEACRAELHRLFPGGRYYSDWVADELFITFIVDDDVQEEQAVTGALALSRALIAARPEFERLHGMPGGIDVGIAAGEAVVGLAGPPRNRKLMALGETAERARSLQSVGKGLRGKLGARDRMIYDERVARAGGMEGSALRLPDDVFYEEAG